MRVGIDIGKALGVRDGIADYCRGVLNALMTEKDSSDEIIPFAFRHPKAPAGGLATTTFEDLEVQVRYPSPDDRLDLLHCTAHTVPSGIFSGTSPELVYTVHDLTFLDYPELHTRLNRVHSLTNLLRAAVAGATFVSVSRATREALMRVLNTEDSKSHVIANGITDFIAPMDDGDESSRRIADGFGLEPGYVLHVGTAEPRKNQRRLIEAHQRLHQDLRAAFPLVWVGDVGWLVDDLEAPDDPFVHRLGRVDDADLVALYDAATVFAYPSIAEGFGLPVVEAMKTGVPVVTSNRSSLPEVAGDAALLVDPFDVAAIADALHALLTDPDERTRLIRLGRARARRFDWRRTAAELLEVYRGVVRDRSGR